MESSLPAHCTLVNDMGRMYVQGSDSRPGSEPSHDANKATTLIYKLFTTAQMLPPPQDGARTFESLSCAGTRCHGRQEYFFQLAALSRVSLI